MNPANYRCRIARESQDILLAQSIRGAVFGRECGYLVSGAIPRDLEQSPWDLHSEALHFLVEDDYGCVGAARLIVGRLRRGFHALGYGVPIEGDFDLVALFPTAECVAEVGRVCILSDHRGRGAAQCLYQALANESLQLGVTRWIGCANTELRSEAAAVRLERKITDLALWADIRFVPRAPVGLAPADNAPPEPDSPGLTPVLRSYVAWGAIRFAGRPVFDRRFNRFAIPFVSDPTSALPATRARPPG